MFEGDRTGNHGGGHGQGHGRGHGGHQGHGWGHWKGHGREHDHHGDGNGDGGSAYDGLYVVDVQGTIDLPVPFLDEEVQTGDPFRMTVAMLFDDPVVTTDDTSFRRYFDDQPNKLLLSVQVGDSEVEHVVEATVHPDDGTTLVIGDDTLYREFLVIPEPPRTPEDLLSVIVAGTSTDPANGQQVWLRAQINVTDPSGAMIDDLNLEDSATFIPPPDSESVANFSRFREGPINFDANLYGIVTSVSLNGIDPTDVFSAESLAAIGYPLQTGGGCFAA